MAASTSSSSSHIPRPLHDVFLSFCGADTRTSFSSHLLAALDRQRFTTFRDDTKLRSGEDISSELLKAIEESRVSIVVFSKKYAASRWCLDELVKIMMCRRDFKQIVLSIFYDVNPSHVRAQLGSYSKAFAKHKDRVKEGTLSMERVERWSAALTEAANLSGYDLQHGDETKLIKEVVKDIVKRLDQLYCHVATHPVGIDSRVEELKELLNMGSNDVRIVAIWGVGGIGKTTIAKAIFNCIRNEFEGSSFLADVSETAKELSGVVKLQKQLLSNILTDDIYNLDNYHNGIEVIKQKLCHRRVLLVLDDVDHVEQLKMLAINRNFFSPGSRIIITTRNMTSLTSLQVNLIYSPKKLNKDESLQLFSWNAFKIDYPEEGYRQLSNEIVAYAKGLPLVLEVLGSFFMGRSTVEWQSELDKLKLIPNGDIQQKLKISFDSLDDKNKELFLDIAFFFIGREKDFAIKVLEDYGCFPESGIGELSRRCLVRVSNSGMLRMHDVLRDMGREIVRQQSLKEPGERSRLWCREEVLQVLRDCTGTKAIEGLSLELPALNNEHVYTKAFANMSNLRLLHLSNLQCLSGTYITTSRNLKWICWHGFPLAYIPATLYMENLVAIDLEYSKLKQIWKEPQRLDKLRFLNLSHSHHLIKTPDFSRLKSLERLLLNDCTSLVKVHDSIGCLDKLLMLNLSNCINLSKVPSNLFMLKSLKNLNFSGCSKLIGERTECKARFSIFRQRLAKRQEYIPISIVSLQGLSCLQELNLAQCNMEYVPSEIGSLITLTRVVLSGNKFCTLPSSFSHLSRLKFLFLHHCVRLESLPNLPKSLLTIGANNCISLDTTSALINIVGSTMNLGHLMFWKCPKLDWKSLSNNFERNFLRMLFQGRQQPQPTHKLRCHIFPSGELLNYMQFQSIGPERLSFVVPPLVGKKIIGFLACGVVPPISSPDGSKIVSNTKFNNSLDNQISIHSTFLPPLNNDEDHEDHVLIYSVQIRDDWGLTLKEADLIQFNMNIESSMDVDDVAVKRLGFSLIYEEEDDDDDDKYQLARIKH